MIAALKREYMQINNPRSLNLLVLGFALSRMSALTAEQKKMFCTLDEIKTVLAERLSTNKALRDASLRALETGCARPVLNFYYR